MPGLYSRIPDEKRYTVDKETGCWNWNMYIDVRGYGQLTVNKKVLFAHRYFYNKYKGEIPANLEIDHLCRNRRCVNPGHLDAVTSKENIRRGHATKVKGDLKDKILNFYRTNIKTYGIRKITAEKFGITKSTVDRAVGMNDRKYATSAF